jgi:hypothetical protein
MNKNPTKQLAIMVAISLILMTVNLACQPKVEDSLAVVEAKCAQKYQRMDGSVLAVELSVLCRLHHDCIGNYVNLLIRKCIDEQRSIVDFI